MSIFSALKGTFALKDATDSDVRLASAPPPPPTSRITMADVTAPPPPPEAKLATAPEDPFDNPENPLGDEAPAESTPEPGPDELEQRLEEMGDEPSPEDLTARARETIDAEQSEARKTIEDETARAAALPEVTPQDVEALQKGTRERLDELDTSAEKAKGVVLDPVTMIELGRPASSNESVEARPSREERRAELESVLSNTPGTNPLSEAGAREELKSMANEEERVKKSEDVQAGLAERARLQRERAKYQKELREANNRPMTTALAEQELARVERELDDLGTPGKAFADRAKPKEDEALPVIEGEATEKPEAPPLPATEGESGKDSNEKQPPVIEGEPAKPGFPFPERPTTWERLSGRSRVVYEAVSNYVGRTIGGRAMALFHDITRRDYEDATMRAGSNLEKRRNKLAELEAQSDGKKGALGYLHERKLKKARTGVRVAERKVERMSGRMNHHAERQNQYLRRVEGRLREKMRPFEELANRERERHKEVSEANVARHKARDVLAERLGQIEADAKQEKGFFMSSDMRAKVADAREKLRNVEAGIAESELEVARANKRLLKAEKKADKWRNKIDELGGLSETELPNIEVSPEAPEGTPGPTAPERGRETAGGTPELIERASVSDYLLNWNTLYPNQRIEAKRFSEALAEQSKGTEVPEEASLDDLIKATGQILADSGKLTSDVRKRNKELRARRDVIQGVLSNPS